MHFETSKRTISPSGELGPLQMVLELDTERCVSEFEGGGHWAVWVTMGVDHEISHRWERGMSASEDVGPRRGWIVRSHISTTLVGEENETILYKSL